MHKVPAFAMSVKGVCYRLSYIFKKYSMKENLMKLKNLFVNLKWIKNKNCSQKSQNLICEGNLKHASKLFSKFKLFSYLYSKVNEHTRMI